MARSKRDEWAKRVEGFNGYTLRWWSCELRRKPKLEDLRPKFVEVMVPTAPVIAEPVPIEVVVRGGVRVVVPIDRRQDSKGATLVAGAPHTPYSVSPSSSAGWWGTRGSRRFTKQRLWQKRVCDSSSASGG